jgi:hypothetical protein
MTSIAIPEYVAFDGVSRLAQGSLADVAVFVKEQAGSDLHPSVLIFKTETGEQIDLDLRGTLEEVRDRHLTTQPETAPQVGPGRPKLGVVAREVTLLPRHWDWLSQQRGGASVALRKLVEEARHLQARPDAVRRAKEATYRFMSVMTGNLDGFEEATRALYAGDGERFSDLTSSWPEDIRDHARGMAAGIWAAT